MGVIKGRTWRGGRGREAIDEKLKAHPSRLIPFRSSKKYSKMAKRKEKKFELILFPKCPQILNRLRPWHHFVLNSPRLTSSWVYTGFRPIPLSAYPSGKSASMVSSGACSLVSHG